MPIRLGLPDTLAGASLPRRLLWLNLLRLIVLTALLALTGFPFGVAHLGLGTESSRLALSALATSFAVAGVLAVLLRKGRFIEGIATTQLVFDQLTWTVFVHLTGGVGSAATLFYGLTCLAGAIATGVMGAWIAAGTACLFYAVLAVSAAMNWVSGPADQNPAFYSSNTDEILYHFGVNVLGIVVVALLGGYLAERLRLTGGKLVEAEERARRAERLAVLGGLASGLAHEIRNPLGSIAGSIRLIASNHHLSGDDKQLCDIIQRETSRLNDLVSDMLDLTRPRAAELVQVDVVAIVNEVVSLTAASGRAVSDVTVRYVGGAETQIVTADAAQLRQLIWNLVRNAVQASAPGDEVRVGVCKDSTHCCVLYIEDDGPGIDAELVSRLFDPFFTTRSHGSGIGLAVVQRIADEHGFKIAVTGKRGQGARFEITLGANVPSA